MTSRCAVAPHHPVPGCQLGPWLLLERYDSGAFGIVFRAQRVGHPEAGLFALKVARGMEDPRFPREVTLLQSLGHASAPRFEDRGWYTSPSGALYPYFVMEWVQGERLYRWARGRTSRQVLHVLHQLASVLAAAHALGSLHRDVKGDNILVTAEGRAVLLDWGAGHHMGAEPVTDSALPPGTAPYRTPEAVRWSWAHRGEGTPYRAGPEDDVYALGVTAYRLCTGTYPPQPEECSGPPRRLLPACELATVSTGLNSLLMACLSENRHARPPAHTLAAAFQAAAAESDALRPIAPTAAAATTETASRPGPRRHRQLPGWVAWAAASMVGGLVVLSGSRAGSTSHAPTELFAQGTQLREVPSLDTTDRGVAERALAETLGRPRAGVQRAALGSPMPKTPPPDQRKPPCERGEKAINGACWVEVSGEKPPCGPKMFDYGDHCYFASYDAPSQPTASLP